jgi:uncharacterized surface protein with fasciclin (FAS1) repeats
MNPNRRTITTILVGATSALALTFGIAFARPIVQLDGLSTQGVTMADYIDTHAVGASNSQCFQDTAQKNQAGYACFQHALQVSGLQSLLNGSAPITVFAPTDAAFAHLEVTAGKSAFDQFMNNKAAMTELVRASIVNGSHTLADLAYQTPFATGSTSVTTIAGTPLAIAFGSLGYTTSRTYVDVGPSSAYDGQSYVDGTPVMVAHNSVLIPLRRITLTSLSA